MNQPFLVLVTATSLIAHAADENKAVFQDMCRILRLTLKPPDVPKLPGGLVVKEKAESVLNHIRMLNFSLTDQLLYDYIMKAEKPGDTKDAEDVTKSLSSSDWDFLKANFGKIKGIEPNELTQKFSRPPSENERRRAHKKVGQILKKATELYEKLSTDELNLEKAVLASHRDLVTAAYGQAVGETLMVGGDTKTVAEGDKSVRATAASFYTNTPNSAGCSGGSAGEGHPGKSMAADILCLCDKASGGIARGGVCDLTVDNHGTEWTNPESGLNAWNALASKCTAQPAGEETAVPTPENLAGALAKFHGLLGSGGENIDQTSFAAATIKGTSNILGFFVTYQNQGVKCDGSDTVSGASHGICVNYNDIIENGKEIEWVKNIKKAMTQLQKVRDIFNHQKDIFTKMEMLEQTGLQIYEDSIEAPESSANAVKVSSSDKGATPPQDSQTATVPSQKEGSSSVEAHIGKLANMITISLVLMF